MRPRHLITLVFLAVLLAAGVWSFYGNVLNPHGDQTMPGMDMAASDTPADAPGDSGAGGATSAEADLLPSRLGEWGLSTSVTGEAALVQVEQLHGKSLGDGITAAWVGQYGGEGGGQPHATIWVSRCPSIDSAQELFRRMTDRISAGGSPFTGLRPIEGQAVEGYALDGMGQTHYYFLIEKDLYWLAVDPEQAEASLGALISGASGKVSNG
ncbi:MAG TPA: hypothetical protein VFD74_08215 [Thermoleophilia bacterium]|nr:hypothetical protein [Thermoleophilia bacterium]